MRLLSVSYPDPARNLALDELLLEGVADSSMPDTLRFWECPVPFIAIGSSQSVAEVVDEAACQRDGVPILRRCSAGGAVLQGPGSFNFAFALSYERYPETAVLHGSYAFLLDKVAQALKLLGIDAARQGVSDLAVEGMKCSGNAQRRKRNACLHHGSLLYQVSMEAMERYLPEPGDRPEYRGARVHKEFVRPVSVTPALLADALRRVFCPAASPSQLSAAEEQEVSQLAREKYSARAWNYRR